jgi:hypothetical protein
MPKTPARDDYFTQSFRFTPEQAAVLKEEAMRLGSSTTFIRQLLDDYRTLYGLPPVLTDQLDAEAAALGKTRREYIIHLLSLRAAQLLKGEVALPSKKAPLKAKR